jgi:hypothetical protein
MQTRGKNYRHINRMTSWKKKMGTVLFPKGEKKRTVFITVFLWLGIVPNNTNLQCFRHHNSSMAPLGTVPRMLLVNSPPVTNLSISTRRLALQLGNVQP